MTRGDEIKYVAFKDYNGMQFRAGTFLTLQTARKWAKQTVAYENVGARLTIRIYKQLCFYRQPKVKK